MAGSYAFLDFLNDALAEAKIQQPNNTASGANTQFARRKFNEMVMGWSANRLRLFFVPEVVYPLVAGLGTYTIGPGAPNFPTEGLGAYTKPVFIQAASVQLGVGTRIPVSIITRPQWDMHPQKNDPRADGPLALFYDYNVAIATLNFAPFPLNPINVYVSQWNALKTFATDELAAFIDDFYPGEYLDALKMGLAIKMSQAMAPSSVNQVMLGAFGDAIGVVERINNDKLSGAFGTTLTLDGPTKGDGSPVAAAAR